LSLGVTQALSQFVQHWKARSQEELYLEFAARASSSARLASLS
jgi:hypothetical protein